MPEIHITINGGNNQILPHAAEAIQNFYGDRFAEKVLGENTRKEGMRPEEERLSLYMDPDNLRRYLTLIGECETATELAKVVVEMVEQEPKLTSEEMVKERFIKLLLPFASKLTKGATVDNVRQRINDAWARRPKRRP